MTKKPYFNQQIADEAAEWAIALDDGPLPPDDSQNLADWLLLSPKHVEELLLASALYDVCNELDPNKTISIDALLSKTAPEVITLMERHKNSRPSGQDKRGALQHANLLSHSRPAYNHWLVWSSGIAAMLILAIALLPFRADVEGEHQPAVAITDTPVPVFRITTNLGEQRKTTLSDGSVVHVNTQSEVTIRYEEHQRIVQLVRGEALFEVAHNPDKPFRVIAGETVTEAVGTTFNIYRAGRNTSVTVINGKVAIETAVKDIDIKQLETSLSTSLANSSASVRRTGDRRLLLEKGQRAIVETANNRIKLETVDIDAVLSWRRGQLIFEREELRIIANEFNRYNRTRIEIADDHVGTIHLSGVFDADDPRSLVETLETLGEVYVDRSNPGIVMLYSKNSGAGKIVPSDKR